MARWNLSISEETDRSVPSIRKVGDIPVVTARMARELLHKR